MSISIGNRAFFKVRHVVLAIFATWGLLVAGAGVGHAEVPAAKRLSAPLVSPGSGWAFYGGNLTHSTGAAAWNGTPPEIVALARTLGSDLVAQGKLSADQYAQNAYTYIRNNIEVEFRFGLGKGGRGALIDQSGTPFDQAELLVRLLRQAGLSASYQVGTATMSAQQFGLWTGLVNGLNEGAQTFTVNAQPACQLLADGGIPAIVNGASDCGSVGGALSSVTLAHIWVSYNGKLYDPAYKVHALKAGIDVPAAMGCGTTSSSNCGANVMTVALSGSTSGTQNGLAYVQITNSAAAQQQLTSYATNLQNNLIATDPNRKIQEVVGGREVDTTQPVSISAALPYTATATTTWTGDIPDAYRTTLRVRNNALDVTFYSDELAGRRLVLTSPGRYSLDALSSGGTYTTCLVTMSSCDGDFTVTLDINHPYAANSGAYADEEVAFDMVSDTVSSHGTFPVVIAHGIGREGLSAEQHLSALQEAHPQMTDQVQIVRNLEGTPPNITTGEFRDDSQAPMLARLLSQGAEIDDISSGLSRSNVTRHHDIGISYAHPYDPNSLSLMSVVSSVSIENAAAPGATEDGVFRSIAHQWAMLEGSINRQLISSDVGLSGPIELAGNATYHYLPGAQNTTGAYAGFDEVYTDGAASETFKPGYEANLISLGLKGGATVVSDPYRAALDTVKINEASSVRKTIGDVSLSEGNDVISVTDLSVGADPRSGLAFTRTYSTGTAVSDEIFSNSFTTEQPNDDSSTTDSGGRLYSGPDASVMGRIGGGWTHNYSVFATIDGDGGKALGAERGLDAANAIAAGQTLLDMMPSSTLNSRAIMPDVAYWLAERLVNNVASVNIGGKVVTFVRLPDGTFSTRGPEKLVQTGIPTKNSGHTDWSPVTLQYTGGEGDTIGFDWSYRLTDSYCCGAQTIVTAAPNFKANTWLKPNGERIDFQYTSYWVAKAWSDPAGGYCDAFGPCIPPQTSGVASRAYVLTGVTNNYGRSLTFNYNISSITECCIGITGSQSVTRDIDFRLTSVVDDRGRTVAFNLSNCPSYAIGAVANCNTLAVTNPNNQTTTYDYTPGSDSPDPSIPVKDSYRLRRIYSAGNSSTPVATLVYDELYRIMQVKDRNGHVTSYFPGAVAGTELWKLAESETPAGEVTTKIYDDKNNEIYSRTPIGRVTTKTYSDAGWPRTTTMPEGNGTTNSYDVRGNVIQVHTFGKNGSDGFDTYTSYGEDPSVVSCNNQVTCNKPSTETDANGNVTNYSWNSTTGDLTKIQKPAVLSVADNTNVRPETDFGYSTFNGISFLTSKTDKISSGVSTTTSYGYNSGNHYTLQTVAADSGGLNQTTTLNFDATGNLISVDGPRTDVDDITYYEWDAARRLVAKITPFPNGSGGNLPRMATRYSYDADNQITKTETGTTTATDVMSTPGNMTVAAYVVPTYDAMGNVVSKTAYDGSGNAQTLSQTDYDADNRPTCAVVRMNSAAFGSKPASACTLGTVGNFGNDRITKTSYDNDSEVTEIDQAFGVAGVQRAYARYTYNPNGTKLYEVDADNNTTQYAYDGFDRLQRTYYPCPSTPSCASSTDYDEFGYDNNGNKTSWRRRNGKIITYSYDAVNRELTRSVSDSSVQAVYSGYDLVGHLLYARYGSTSGAGITNVYDNLGELTSTTDMNGRAISYKYDSASNRTKLTYPDGNWQPYGYDSTNRVISSGLGSGNFYFSYDSLGRTSSVSHGTNGSAGTVGMSYDSLGRLTGLSNDIAGTANDVSWTFAYNPSSQIVNTSASSTAYDYRETDNSTLAKTYDGLNRDATLVGTSSPCPAGGYDANGNLICDGTRTFTYDVYNHLLATTGNGANLSLVYDPMGRLAQYSIDGGAHFSTFLYDGTNLISEYDPSGTLTQRYIFGPGTDQPILWFQGSQNSNPLFFIQDYHGSVIGYTDASGNLTDTYKYGPYGEPKNGGNWTSFTGARFRYTGQAVIPEAGLYYYKARVYDPMMGRFLQTDPIGSKDDLDLYSYVADDPIDHTDPTGTTIDAPNPKDRQALLNDINSLSKTQYKFDKAGNLVKDADAKANAKGSSYFSKQLDRGIAGKATVEIAISAGLDDPKGSKPEWSVRDEGGGATRRDGSRSVVDGTVPSGLRDTRGRPLVETPALVLMHELAGHSLPETFGGGTGNAVDDENKVRAQLGLPLRSRESNHPEDPRGQ